MNFYQKLKREHDDHRLLMRRIAETSGDSDERQRLFDLLVRDVESHAAAAEQTLYSERIEATEGPPPTRHSVSEHEPTRDSLDELKKTDTSSPGWLVTFEQFRAALEHQMREEEQQLFERSEQPIDVERADERGFESDGRKQVEQRRFEQ